MIDSCYCPATKEVPLISKREEEEARKPGLERLKASAPTHTIEVKIPVTVIQRGGPERKSKPYTVEFDGSKITLRDEDGIMAFSFPWAGIEAAIGVLG